MLRSLVGSEMCIRDSMGSSISPSKSMSAIPASSSAMVLIPTTAAPPSYHVKTELTLIWADFCKHSQEFRDGIAKLLSNRLNEKQESEQVIVFNMDNCNTNPNETAVVKFYIATNNSKTPSEPLTVLAGELLLELINAEETVEIGPHFGKGTVSLRRLLSIFKC